ncbi:hypothetical protein EYD45_09760 [Hyunsoonleella flava]|uniref:NlpE C-terminal OB domain-containing protein n=1 Tax=Hyunsoonleella flava TaxID=2527939 RepID=A0A4Q9FCJ4_9FLAO|nr:hypothetical protein [Hyunsoonleella flava]TBN03285.1 hypothetical protein EYD45_09760 [Hyunsoonleella flava]
MKKTFILLICFSAFLSCKKDMKSEKADDTISTESEERTAKQSDGLTLLKGDYVYHGGAAVLQTHAEIYGVLPTHNFDQLNKKAEKLKTEPTDMVQVEIRGKISNEKHETILWENKVEVVEILSVKPNTEEKNNIIKLGS